MCYNVMILKIIQQLMPVLPSYRNQSIDLLCKSIDWFLCEGNTGIGFLTNGLFSFRFTSNNETLWPVYLLFKSFVEYCALSLYFKCHVHVVYLTKMKILTYTSYQQHFDLYIEIHGLIVINSC